MHNTCTIYGWMNAWCMRIYNTPVGPVACTCVLCLWKLGKGSCIFSQFWWIYSLPVRRKHKCGLLWQNREQVASDIRLISDSIHTNSVGYMISDNQLDQYLQFVKDVLLEEVKFISEPLIHCLCQWKLAYHSCSQQDNSIHCSFVLSETSQMSLATPSLLRQSRSQMFYFVGY